jgi:hypothetical protein
MADTFERRRVVGHGIKMKKVDGPLGKALSVNKDLAPELGDEGAMVIWYSTAEIQHRIVDDTDGGVQRVAVLAITNAAPVDEAAVAEVLADQEARQATAHLDFGSNGDTSTPTEGEPAPAAV